MKHSLIVLFSLLSFTFCFASCDTDGPIELPDTDVLTMRQDLMQP